MRQLSEVRADRGEERGEEGGKSREHLRSEIYSN